MVVQRSISRGKYILAAVFTLIIFGFGILLGIMLDNARLGWAKDKSADQEVDYESLQLQYLYLSSLEDGGKACAVLKTALEKSISELGGSLEKITEYEKQTQLNKKEYGLVKRGYLLDNLKYWLLAKKAKKMCNFDIVSILYFNSKDNCPDCPNQGVILTYFKNVFDNRLLVFPIDIDLENGESMITLLKSGYHIATLPSIVIEDTNYEGIVDKERLKELICLSFDTQQPECS